MSDTPAAAPSPTPPSGFVSSEFITTIIVMAVTAWSSIQGNLPPATAALLMVIGAAVYTIARTALKAAHALGYAKAFPDLPDPTGLLGANRQAGFADPAALLLVLILAVFVTACAVTPKTPAQTVYAIEGDYIAALDVAVAYRGLPACGGATKVCSDPAVVKKLQAAKDCASAGLTFAENLVRGLPQAPKPAGACQDPGTVALLNGAGAVDVPAATALAQRLVASLASLTGTLTTK